MAVSSPTSTGSRITNPQHELSSGSPAHDVGGQLIELGGFGGFGGSYVVVAATTPMLTLTLDAHNVVPIMGQGNQTYLLIDDAAAALIDAGTGLSAHLADIAAALDRAGATLEQVIVTHAHGDHMGGAPALAHAYPRARFRKIPWPGED